MLFLASTRNRSSRVLSTSGPNFVALEQFAPNSPFIALTAPTTWNRPFDVEDHIKMYYFYLDLFVKNNIFDYPKLKLTHRPL